MGENGFKDLMIWYKAKELAVTIYKKTDAGRIGRDFGLRDQMRRSAVSIASNIAEGDERDTNKEAVRFFYIAKGSLAELRTQMQIAHEIDYVKDKTYEGIERKCEALGKMIGKLIKTRKTKTGERL